MNGAHQQVSDNEMYEWVFIYKAWSKDCPACKAWTRLLEEGKITAYQVHVHKEYIYPHHTTGVYMQRIDRQDSRMPQK